VATPENVSGHIIIRDECGTMDQSIHGDDQNAAVTPGSVASNLDRDVTSVLERRRNRILPLSAEAISQIHSSKHITSLQGVILSLLENSLDANAAKIDITVDWKRGGCTVDDDGIGIPASEFTENGGLGRMYCTSKRSPVGAASGLSEVHGLTGTFLAELAAMSLLSITSTYFGGTRSATLTLHQGKPIARKADDVVAGIGPHSSFQSGTNVGVRDLFGNMPVRVKQRAQILERESDEERQWHELKSGIVALLLAWSRPCAVKLSDSNNSRRVLSIFGQHSSISGALTPKSLRQLGGKYATYDLRDKLSILFQSGLASAHSRARWVPLSAVTSAISLKGLVCLDPAPSRHCQFIAVGVCPCSADSDLHQAVGKVFANSSFGSIDDNNTVSVSASAMGKTRAGQPSTRQVQIRKGIDRYPMYAIQLQESRISGNHVGLDQMSEASLKALTDVLEAAVSAWLERNHFRPRKRRKRSHRKMNTSLRPVSATEATIFEAQTIVEEPKQPAQSLEEHTLQVPKSRPAIDMTKDMLPGIRHTAYRSRHVDLSGMTRIRRGQSKAKARMYESHDGTSPHSPSFDERDEANVLVRELSTAVNDNAEGSLESRRIGKDKAPSSEDFDYIDDLDMIAAAEGIASRSQDMIGEDGTFHWIDPVSKQSYRVNSRTGVVLPPESPADATIDRTIEEALPRKSAGIDTTLSSGGKPISLARRSKLPTDHSITTEELQCKQLPASLRGWMNPVFARQDEEPIRVASTHGPGLLELDEHGNCCQPKNARSNFASYGSTLNAGLKLSRSALQRASVIRQVDKKFILCKIPSALSGTAVSGQILTLVDQHAASERVILEALFGNLCAFVDNAQRVEIQSASLTTQTSRAKAIVFEVSDREREMFQLHHEHFSAWGIHYKLIANMVDCFSGGSSSRLDQRIVVKSLPAVVAERCANAPALCIEMLRTELWELADGTKRPISSLNNIISMEREAGTQPWLAILPLLPSGLRDMLHSRSCRSAIMFNDDLTHAECEKLLQDLSKCVFPFICAHGRTSMVPLAELDPDSESILDIDGNSSGKRPFGSGLETNRESICEAGSLVNWMNGR